MNSNLAFDFTVDKTNNTILVTREFAAERDLVWDAYTKPEILDQWWAPRPWKATTKSQSFTEGGKWIYAMKGPMPDGEIMEHWAVAEYRLIQPKTKFTGLDSFSDENGIINTEMPQSKWEVSFTDKGEHTEVKSQIVFADLKQLEETIQMGFKEGYTSAMENLDELLPTLK